MQFKIRIYRECHIYIPFQKTCFSAFNAWYNSWVPNGYLISLISLYQYPLLVCFTIVHKTAILGWFSGLAVLHQNKPLTTVVCNNPYLLLFKVLVPSTLNIFSVSGIVTSWDFSIFIGNPSIMFFTYFRISIFTYPFIV